MKRLEASLLGAMVIAGALNQLSEDQSDSPDDNSVFYGGIMAHYPGDGTFL